MKNLIYLTAFVMGTQYAAEHALIRISSLRKVAFDEYSLKLALMEKAEGKILQCSGCISGYEDGMKHLAPSPSKEKESIDQESFEAYKRGQEVQMKTILADVEKELKKLE